MCSMCSTVFQLIYCVLLLSLPGCIPVVFHVCVIIFCCVTSVLLCLSLRETLDESCLAGIKEKLPILAGSPRVMQGWATTLHFTELVRICIPVD